ncbi:contact-dependent growth inhibition system immunity protein [Nocardioides mangrovi]|uniref:contact-dependent growth inhibition system immunity protein n=1 Tax=Nocardioides mangrovi TaxID=2874580 RepID=UPI0027E15A58|nr:contact-dependent growth inhibition system immunity protein [Nocardioides mangrovi]
MGAYFHQDMFDLYDDEFAAVDAFVASDPERARALPNEVARVLHENSTEDELEALLRGFGLAFSTGGVTYREWLTQIADHVRAST